MSQPFVRKMVRDAGTEIVSWRVRRQSGWRTQTEATERLAEWGTLSAHPLVRLRGKIEWRAAKIGALASSFPSTDVAFASVHWIMQRVQTHRSGPIPLFLHCLTISPAVGCRTGLHRKGRILRNNYFSCSPIWLTTCSSPHAAHWKLQRFDFPPLMFHLLCSTSREQKARCRWKGGFF